MESKKLIQNCLLAAASALLTLMLAEAALSLFMPVYDYRDRSLLFDRQPFKQYSGGSIRHPANTNIREVAVYHDKIEYDVSYHTNNLGFIDTKDYRKEVGAGRRYFAFVGDSFAAGVHGGAAWVPKLRSNRLGAEVYNMGVAGTGFDHFYRLLHDMKGRISITDIIIVAITDDLYRDFWHPYMTGNDIHFCAVPGEHANCQENFVASLLPVDASPEAVKALAGKKYREQRARYRKYAETDSISAKIAAKLYDSHLYYYGRIVSDSLSRSHPASSVDSAIVSLVKIRADFPDARIKLVHLPQKYEVATRTYASNIREQVTAVGIDYFPALDACTWSTDMFFRRDGHPNRLGYDNIARCVSGYLFDQ